MIDIEKSFGGIHALKDVSLKVAPGEIHALVGENGAGKSTMMKILSGVYEKDAGEIQIEGQEISKLSPQLAKFLGIEIIYQEFALAPHLSVAENIFLNELGNQYGVINYSNLYKKAGEIIQNLGFDLDVKARVGELSVAYQQVVEIAKALSKQVKVLILDEPTAVLAPKEVERLLTILKKFKEEGVSIIYISHRLDEVKKISDTVTIMKDGRVVKNIQTSKISKEEIINHMIGRKLDGLFPIRDKKTGLDVLKVEHISRGKMVKNVSFTLKKGEILGIAGLVGSGRSELARAIFGVDHLDSGKIFLDGKEVRISCCKDGVKSGMAFVPENRKEEGVILNLSIKENTMMTKLKEISTFGVIKKKEERTKVNDLINALNIKTKSGENKVTNLSGGNQQKVVLAKWMDTNHKVIILDEPTRGVDVGAKYEIYSIINELAEQGMGIIFISSEMVEIIGMCDRALVMGGGEVKGELEEKDLTEDKIMKLAINER